MKRICVDWDGTLVEEKWPEMGDWLPGAVDALKELASLYDEVVIFSCRLAKMDTDEITPRENYDQIIAMNLMLEQAKIPGNVILWTKDYKPPADFYVDDKAIRFSGDWAVTSAALIGASKVSEYPMPPMSVSDSDPGDETEESIMDYAIRTFETGATRDTDDGKLDYEGFLSPLVLRRYAEYMHAHRIQSNGELRASDNWQKGIPRDAYMKSAFRHFMDWWDAHRSESAVSADGVSLDEAICALIFNASGYLHELMVR